MLLPRRMRPEDGGGRKGTATGAGGRGGDRSDDGAVFSDDDLWSEGDDEGDVDKYRL